MIFRDQRLVCEKCGTPWIFTVTEQRRLAETQEGDEIVLPTICPKCQAKAQGTPQVGHEHREPAEPAIKPAIKPATKPVAKRVPEKQAEPSKSTMTLFDEFPHEEEGIEVKLIGTVKWFSRQKGYGFITKADGEDIFFHRADVSRESHEWPEEDQKVEFQIRKTEKGLEAFNVSILPTD